MDTIIEWVQGDYNAALSFILENADGSVFDLTNYTLTFNAQQGNVSGLKFSGAMTVDSPTAGTCHYSPIATDFNKTGQYSCQIVAVGTNPVAEVTWPDIKVYVEPRIPAY